MIRGLNFALFIQLWGALLSVLATSCVRRISSRNHGPELGSSMTTVFLCEFADQNQRAANVNLDAAFSKLRDDVYSPNGFSFDVRHVGADDCTFDSKACAVWEHCTHARGTCFGNRTGVYCDARVLRHFFAAAAESIALSAVQSQDSNRWSESLIRGPLSLLRVTSPVGPSDSPSGQDLFERLIGTSISHDELALASDVARRIENQSAWSPSQAMRHEIYAKASATYTLAGEYALAFLIGHEFAHVTGDCKASAVNLPFEEVVDLAARKQASGDGVCALAISKDEIEADKCGLRATNALNDRMSTRYRGPDDVELLNSSRSAATDTVTMMLLFLLKGSGAMRGVHLSGADGPLRSDFIDLTLGTPTLGHMYPSLRSLLFFSFMNRLQDMTEHASAWSLDMTDSLAEVAVTHLALSSCKCATTTTASQLLKAFASIMNKATEARVSDSAISEACHLPTKLKLVPDDYRHDLDNQDERQR